MTLSTMFEFGMMHKMEFAMVIAMAPQMVAIVIIALAPVVSAIVLRDASLICDELCRKEEMFGTMFNELDMLRKMEIAMAMARRWWPS